MTCVRACGVRTCQCRRNAATSPAPSYEEEDTCMSYEEEDTCLRSAATSPAPSYEEEDTCMSYDPGPLYGRRSTNWLSTKSTCLVLIGLVLSPHAFGALLPLLRRTDLLGAKETY